MNNSESLLVRGSAAICLAYTGIFNKDISNLLLYITENNCTGVDWVWDDNFSNIAKYAWAYSADIETLLNTEGIKTKSNVAGNINSDKKNKAIEAWGYSICLSGIIICLACSLTFVFSKQIITFLYSDKYISGEWIFRVYAITSLVKITSWGIILNSTQNNKMILKSSIYTLVINLIFNYILLGTVGVIGAAIATMISEFAGIMIKLYYSTKAISIKMDKIIPWKELGKIVITNILFCCLMLGLENIIESISVEFNMYIEMIILIVPWILLYIVVFRKRFIKMWKNLNEV